MGRPRAGVARDTRKLILDAAVDLLSERGARGTSMRALAAAVGLRESALYHHFPSKDSLLLAMLNCVFEDMTVQMERHLAQEPDHGQKGRFLRNGLIMLWKTYL